MINDQVKAMCSFGLKLWLTDRRSIIQRLVIWPNAIPLGFMLIFSIGVSALLFQSESPGGGMSKSGGITFTVFGDPVKDKVGQLLGTSPTNFKYVSVDDSIDIIQNKISNSELTFAIEVEVNESGSAIFRVHYDQARKYPHKHWIEQSKNRLADIALALRKYRLQNHAVPAQELAFALAPISFEALGFGHKKSNSLIFMFVLIIWLGLVISPIDNTTFILSHLMLSDHQNGFGILALSARLKPTVILFSRLMVVLSVLFLSQLVMLGYIIFWFKMYGLLISNILPYFTPEQLSSPNISLMTVGYLDFVSAIGFTDVLVVFLSVFSIGILVTLFRMKLSLYIVHSEQLRTKLKAVDLLLFNMPLILYFVSGINFSAYIGSIPIWGGIVMIKQVLSHDISLLWSICTLMSVSLLSALLFYNIQSKIFDQKRFCLENR